MGIKLEVELTLEQKLWLERKGVADVEECIFLRQSRTYVYIWNRKYQIEIKRRKDVKGWNF